MSTAHSYPELPPDDLWIFGYGSLMWRPEFEFVASAPAKVFGFRRDLCLWSIVHRGTHERPGLVFGLTNGGSCLGRAFRVDTAKKDDVLDYLWQREMVRYAYIPKLVRIHIGSDIEFGLTFVVDTQHPQYAQDLSDKTIASVIGASRGRSGHNREYFLDCLNKFEEMGVCTNRYKNIKALISNQGQYTYQGQYT